MFVQIHTLRDYAVAIPNRGADGLAKRAVYGGVERQRISSQCIKAAIRDATGLLRMAPDGALLPDDLTDLAVDLGLSLSVRSARIGERKLAPLLRARGLPYADAAQWTDAVMALWRSGKPAAAEGDGKAKRGKVKEGDDAAAEAPAAVEDEGGAAPLVVGETEIAALATLVEALRAAGQDPSTLRKLFTQPKAPKDQPAAVTAALEELRAMKSHAGVDGALFGRFATGVALSNVDGAVHVAHALTVHEIAAIADFFSAQDKLREEHEAGASHINTAEYASGLFYGYAVIDLRQLERNFAGLTVEQRGQLAAWLVRAFGRVEPAAKRGSTAPYAGLRQMMVELGPWQPRTLIGAFERPVEPARGETVSERSRAQLLAHAEEMDALLGPPAWRGALVGDAPAPAQKPRLDVLADTVAEKVAALGNLAPRKAAA